MTPEELEDLVETLTHQNEDLWAVLVDLYRGDTIDEDARYRIEDLAELHDLDL